MGSRANDWCGIAVRPRQRVVGTGARGTCEALIGSGQVGEVSGSIEDSRQRPEPATPLETTHPLQRHGVVKGLHAHGARPQFVPTEKVQRAPQ